MTLNKEYTMLEYALHYANHGLHVFPAHNIINGRCSCSASNCTSPGKHPAIRGWQSPNVALPGSIRSYWGKLTPNANIAIATGRRSGCFVMDVDGAQGAATLQKLESTYGRLPETLSAATGRGRHLYFKYPYSPVSNGIGKLGPGVDIRGDEGYVIAPPSRHHSGVSYCWVDPLIPMSASPDWLIELVTNEQKLRTAEVPQRASVSAGESREIPEGTRNDTLFRAGCSLRARGAEEDEIVETLMNMNQEQCATPLSPSEVEVVARSAAKYDAGPKKPEAKPKNSHLWFLPLDLIAWNADTRISLLTDYQMGWYIRLLVLAWPNQGYLPNDPLKLSRLACAEDQQQFVNESAEVLQFFEPADDDETRIYHPTLRDLWLEKKGQVEKNTEAARIGVLKRKEAA